MMPRVIIESPLSAPDRQGIERNKAYAFRAVRDSLRRGEAPYASHLFFDRPELLDDLRPEERTQGMEAGFAWGAAAELIAVYIDLGISGGMKRGIYVAQSRNIPIEYRQFGVGDWRVDYDSRIVPERNVRIMGLLG